MSGKLDDLLAIRRRADETFDVTVGGGVEAYFGARHLRRVLPLGPEEPADNSKRGARMILARLALALRAERNRGRAGHWTYDLNRHIALVQAYEAERRLLIRRGAIPAD